jgi:hypothetical protein
MRELDGRALEDGDKVGFMDPIASVVVYVAPCMRLIDTALGVCRRIGTRKGRLLEFSIRVDDRLRSSCCTNFQSCARLEELVRSLKEKETIKYQTRASLLEFLDLVWMEQRLEELDENPEAPMDARRIDHIFRERSNTTPDEALAAILIIGEDEDIIQIMDMLPVEKVPRVPRVGDFFKLESTHHLVTSLSGAPGRYPWSRKSLGTYFRNHGLESKRIVHLPPSPAPSSSLATSSADSHSGTSANTQTGSKKRKLSSQTSVDLGDREDDDDTQSDRQRF